MPPSTPGDRPRPVGRAVLGCRVAGVLVAGLGRWGTTDVYWAERPSAAAETWAAAVVLGVAYWVLAYSLGRRRKWAAVAALVLTVLTAGYLLLADAADVVLGAGLFGRTIPGDLAAIVAARGAAAAGLAWLAWQVCRSIGATRRAAVPGFDVGFVAGPATESPRGTDGAVDAR